MDTDTQQLIYFAKHYMQIANRINLTINDQSKTIDMLYNEYPQNKRSNVYLFMAHLASSAYRIATVIDKYSDVLSAYNYRCLARRNFSGDIANELRNNISHYFPMLLRDLVGHNLEDDHRLAGPRKSVVHEMTPNECKENLQTAIRQIEQHLLDNNFLQPTRSPRG